MHLSQGQSHRRLPGRPRRVPRRSRAKSPELGVVFFNRHGSARIQRAFSAHGTCRANLKPPPPPPGTTLIRDLAGVRPCCWGRVRVAAVGEYSGLMETVLPAASIVRTPVATPVSDVAVPISASFLPQNAGLVSL